MTYASLPKGGADSGITICGRRQGQEHARFTQALEAKISGVHDREFGAGSSRSRLGPPAAIRQVSPAVRPIGSGRANLRFERWAHRGFEHRGHRGAECHTR
ncbi:MAG: hypothetical protein EBR34_08265 [Sphingomonadaceae bacterium]|nr:hypothetical protein [Sphingomonadaceae bacterium]